MACRLRITETAKKELRRLPGYVRQRARHIVKVLAVEHSSGRGPEVRGSETRFFLAEETSFLKAREFLLASVRAYAPKTEFLVPCGKQGMTLELATTPSMRALQRSWLFLA